MLVADLLVCNSSIDFYQIASLFHMYIDMGGRIAGKQDRFSLIIENPLRAPKIPQKYIFFLHFGP